TLVGPVTVTSLQCAASSLGSNSSTICTVTLSGPAQAGGALVGLSASASTLMIPVSVTAVPGVTTATFTASVGTVSGNQSVTITASINGSSRTATISLIPGIIVTSLQCVSSFLGSNGSTPCTVGLSGPAPVGGSTVALSDDNDYLTIPNSIAITAGASS